MINLKTATGNKIDFTVLEKIPTSPSSCFAYQILKTSHDRNGNARSAILYYGFSGVVRIVCIDESWISVPYNSRVVALPTMNLSLSEFKAILSEGATSLISINHHSEVIYASR